MPEKIVAANPGRAGYGRDIDTTTPQFILQSQPMQERSTFCEAEGMLDHTDKAERYWTLMLKYHELAEQAELPLLRDPYFRVATRYRSMAKRCLRLGGRQSTPQRLSSRP
jgi:hypothetical protein